MSEQGIVPGLAGVPVVESSVGFIDGHQGILEYRGHRIEDLAENSTFVETAFSSHIASMAIRASLRRIKNVSALCRFGMISRSFPIRVNDSVRIFPAPFSLSPSSE